MKVKLWKNDFNLSSNKTIFSKKKLFNSIKTDLNKIYKQEYKIINEYSNNLYWEIWKYLSSAAKFSFSKNNLWKIRTKIDNLREYVYYWLIKLIWIDWLYNWFNDSESFVKKDE